MFHHKTNSRAMRAATETMVKLLGLTDRKGGGFFVVEWAAGGEIRTGLFERHIALDHVYNIETIKQILNEIFWNHASTPPFHYAWQKTKECLSGYYLGWLLQIICSVAL